MTAPAPCEPPRRNRNGTCRACPRCGTARAAASWCGTRRSTGSSGSETTHCQLHVPEKSTQGRAGLGEEENMTFSQQEKKDRGRAQTPHAQPTRHTATVTAPLTSWAGVTRLHLEPSPPSAASALLVAVIGAGSRVGARTAGTGHAHRALPLLAGPGCSTALTCVGIHHTATERAQRSSAGDRVGHVNPGPGLA